MKLRRLTEGKIANIAGSIYSDVGLREAIKIAYKHGCDVFFYDNQKIKYSHKKRGWSRGGAVISGPPPEKF